MKFVFSTFAAADSDDEESVQSEVRWNKYTCDTISVAPFNIMSVFKSVVKAAI